MSKTVTFEVFRLDELSEQSKKKVLFDFSDINLIGDWWDWAYEDAKMIGVKINHFDVEYPKSCLCIFEGEPAETARLLLKEFGDNDTDLLNSAKGFLNGNCKKKDFLKEISHYYGIMLTNDYQSRQSDEQISESIVEGDYWFTKDGKHFKY